MRNRADVYAEVDAERDRQAKKWGCLHAWGVGDCSSASVHNSTKVMVLAGIPIAWPCPDREAIGRLLPDPSNRLLKPPAASLRPGGVPSSWPDG